MISPSLPEPLCDVAAQIMALRDRRHPKDAVWLARGTGSPQCDDLIVLRLSDGMLVTTDRGKATRLLADPSDDTLAEILGYDEPKSRIVGMPVVVQALSRDAAVVLEMVASRERLSAALGIANRHGDARVLSVEAALKRRLVLFGMED